MASSIVGFKPNKKANPQKKDRLFKIYLLFVFLFYDHTFSYFILSMIYTY